ncbi:MAG: hypothetical protein ACJ0DD_02685 [Paracoccaceae bacterium]
MLEGGLTPILSLDEMKAIGYNIAFHPLTLLAASMYAMKNVLQQLKENKSTDEFLLNFKEIRETVGFNKYYKIYSQYNSLDKVKNS